MFLRPPDRRGNRIARREEDGLPGFAGAAQGELPRVTGEGVVPGGGARQLAAPQGCRPECGAVCCRPGRLRRGPSDLGPLPAGHLPVHSSTGCRAGDIAGPGPSRLARRRRALETAEKVVTGNRGD